MNHSARIMENRKRKQNHQHYHVYYNFYLVQHYFCTILQNSSLLESTFLNSFLFYKATAFNTTTQGKCAIKRSDLQMPLNLYSKLISSVNQIQGDHNLKTRTFHKISNAMINSRIHCGCFFMQLFFAVSGATMY